MTTLMIRPKVKALQAALTPMAQVARGVMVAGVSRVKTTSVVKVGILVPQKGNGQTQNIEALMNPGLALLIPTKRMMRRKTMRMKPIVAITRKNVLRGWILVTKPQRARTMTLFAT
jgi:hypothetical protein